MILEPKVKLSRESKEFKINLCFLVNQTMMQPKTAKLYVPQVDEVVEELVAK